MIIETNNEIPPCENTYCISSLTMSGKRNRFLSPAADLDGRDQPSRPGRFS